MRDGSLWEVHFTDDGWLTRSFYAEDEIFFFPSQYPHPVLFLIWVFGKCHRWAENWDVDLRLWATEKRTWKSYFPTPFLCVFPVVAVTPVWQRKEQGGVGGLTVCASSCLQEWGPWIHSHFCFPNVFLPMTAPISLSWLSQWALKPTPFSLLFRTWCFHSTLSWGTSPHVCQEPACRSTVPTPHRVLVTQPIWLWPSPLVCGLKLKSVRSSVESSVWCTQAFSPHYPWPGFSDLPA